MNSFILSAAKYIVLLAIIARPLMIRLGQGSYFAKIYFNMLRKELIVVPLSVAAIINTLRIYDTSLWLVLSL